MQYDMVVDTTVKGTYHKTERLEEKTRQHKREQQQ